MKLYQAVLFFSLFAASTTKGWRWRFPVSRQKRRTTLHVELEPISWENVGELKRVNLASFPFQLSNSFYEGIARNNKRGLNLLALSDGKTVGAISSCVRRTGFFQQRKLHVMSLAVLDPYRGHGVGSQLMERLLKYCREHRIQEITLDTCTSNNNEALRLFDRFGFTRSKCSGDAVYLMSRDLGRRSTDNSTENKRNGAAGDAVPAVLLAVLRWCQLSMAVSMTKSKYTPLRYVARNNPSDMATLWLDRGANIDATDDEGWTPLHQAAREGNTKMIALLLDRGANINASDDDGWTPLHWALCKRNTEVISVLLDGGADIDAAGGVYGMTPLHVAVVEGDTEMTAFLLDRGANVNASDDNGWTSLHCAACKQNTEITALLLDRGANVNASNESGWTPFHAAVMWKGNTETVTLLLDRGADIDMTTKGGKGVTALHISAVRGNMEVAKLLLDHGANAYATDAQNLTLLYHASKSGNKELVHFLLQRGGLAAASSG